MQDDMIFDKYDEEFFGLTQAIELTMQNLYLVDDRSLFEELIKKMDKHVRQLEILVRDNMFK